MNENYTKITKKEIKISNLVLINIAINSKVVGIIANHDRFKKVIEICEIHLRVNLTLTSQSKVL